MSDPRPDPISVQRVTPAVAIVAIERVSRFNTLSIDTLEAIDAAFVELAADTGVVAVIVKGSSGRAFAAGADLREVGALNPRDALAFSARGRRVFDRIERAPQFVVAAIDGYCMGGGLDLALACDVRHASPSSTFAHPGALRGIVTGFGGTGRLPRLVGRASAYELFVTGCTLDAAEALSIGLVDRLEDDPIASALDVAHRTAERWPVAAAWMKGSAVRWWRKGRRG